MIDHEGYCTIVGRAKDTIIRGGENIAPREVEDVLTRHPDVSSAAVIGTPDDKWGEAVTAYVVLRNDRSLDPQDLMDLVREEKGRFQTPKLIYFVDAIPMTPVGKPDKKALRALHV